MASRIYWQIHKLAFLLEKRADEELKQQVDIGFAQYKVLEAINQNSLVKQNEVAEMLDQTEASISRQIKILHKKGLINVNIMMGNKRARELTLTVVGDEIVSEAERVIEMSQTKTLGSLNVKEQRILMELMERMLQGFKKE